MTARDATLHDLSREHPGLRDEIARALMPQTDLGNAERHASRMQGRLIRVSATGWHVWDDRRWARDEAGAQADRAAFDTVRAIQVEAATLRDSSEADFVVDEKDGEPIMLSDKLAKWGRASESATKIRAVLNLSAAFLTVEVERLDSDPMRVNVQNGTLTVAPRAGDEDPIGFAAHAAADYITKLAPVEYDPAATCPTYDRFLQEVQPNPDVRRFLHQWGGYSLIGDTSEQKLCFWYGKGRNGKSTLIDTWAHVAGDYGETVPIETFLDQGKGRNAGAATPDLALLPGVRFLRTSEPEKGAKLAESLIKLVTGGEPIQARHLNRDYFKFRPSFKLTMSGNYRPSISGTDEGIWRRVVLVPWPVTVERPDPELLAKLKLEASGILNRLLDGLRDYLENGLMIPDDVGAATAEYRDDSDPLGRFLASCVARVDGERVPSSQMHGLFCAWARAEGERLWTPKGLAMAMKEQGYRSMHSNGMHWLNCRLVKAEADFGPAPLPQEQAEDDG